MKQKILGLKGLFFLLAVVLFVFAGKTQVVSAAPQYTVTFANAKGVVSNNIYKKLAVTAEAGTVIKLPDIPREGYRAFWVQKSPTQNKKYKAGSRFQIKGDVVLCLSYSKLYTVRFMTANGRKEYTSLRMQLCKGQYLSFPDGNDTDTQRFLGWSKSVGDMYYKKPGQKIKVTGNMRFYATSQRVYTITLCEKDGSVYKTYKVPVSETMAFPNVRTGTADMFIGWSVQPGMSKLPEYFAGDKIPRKAGKYYMVVYEAEMDRAPATIAEPLKHERVYLVGDSRTADTKLALGSKASEKVQFICQGGKGLDWFKSTGYEKLMSDIRKQPKRMKKAIVVNFGVNDMFNAKAYVVFLRKLAEKMKSYNCEMYFMSVNPVNSVVSKAYGITRLRKEEDVARFNNVLYYGVCADRTYTYINTYTHLKKNGWISDRWATGRVDGLHYSPNTYLKIYDYCIRFLNR